jgi:2C-methyl-D-erythritol 2,4-cyclodiphosphate synthase
MDDLRALAKAKDGDILSHAHILAIMGADQPGAAPDDFGTIAMAVENMAKIYSARSRWMK